MAKQKSGKANRKHGNKKKFCEAYRARGQREMNKAVHMLKHLDEHPLDAAALLTFQGLPTKARKHG